MSAKDLELEIKNEANEQLDKAQANLKFPEWWCEVFKHMFHWSEVLIVTLVLTAGVLTIVAFATPPVPGESDAAGLGPVPAIIIFVICTFSLWFLWNLNKYRALAVYAEALKQQVGDLGKKNEVLEEQNQVFINSNSEQKGLLDEIAKDMGLLNASNDQIAQAIGKLNQLADEQNLVLYLRDELLTKQRQQKEELTLINKDQGKENIKAKMMNFFTEVDDNGTDTIDEKEEIEKLKDLMSDNGIEWTDDFEDIYADDGKIYRWEFLNALDRVLETRFYRIKDALQKHKDLTDKLSTLEGRL